MNLENPPKRKRKNTDVEKDQSQSNDENCLNSSNSPARRSKLTTVNSSDGSENQPTAQIAMVSTVLSKMISTICELEENVMSFEY